MTHHNNQIVNYLYLIIYQKSGNVHIPLQRFKNNNIFWAKN